MKLISLSHLFRTKDKQLTYLQQAFSVIVGFILSVEVTDDIGWQLLVEIILGRGPVVGECDQLLAQGRQLHQHATVLHIKRVVEHVERADKAATIVLLLHNLGSITGVHFV